VILAENDFVMLHGRFSGMGQPTKWNVVDVIRLEDGVLAEHWDMIQDEASEESSRSALPMFGSGFPARRPVAEAAAHSPDPQR
jgi:predicted SnoaL-like aldol condensation-catalyzing enzyme